MRTHVLAVLAVLAVVPLVASACRGDVLTPLASSAEPALEPWHSGDAALELVGRTSHPRVLAGDRREVFLYLALCARERGDVPRLGLNLALVIDRSGSMGEQDKLVFARSAAEQLVGRLAPDDRLAVVAYDDEVVTLVPSTPARERDTLTAAIRELVPGGATDLHGGMVSGYEEVLKAFDPARVNKVVLLSDGLANRGVTNRAEISARAERCLAKGVRVTAMGMGLDYDEVLLGGIARHAGGNYYYVGAAEEVGEHLDQEIDTAARVVARDLEVRVALGEGVQLVQVFGYPYTEDEGTVVVPVNDMHGGERRKVVLRLSVPAGSATSGVLARPVLRYADALSRSSRVDERPALAWAASADPEAVRRARDLEVLVKSEIVQNAVAMERAMELQKSGRFEEAQELLGARYVNSRTLNDAEYGSAELARMLETIKTVLEDIERTRNDREARRDLQLATQLQALGYGGGD